MLSRRFVNVNNFQFNDKFINFKLKNNEKNVNCLIDDNVQKMCRENIFYFNINLMLQRTKELTIIICFLISLFNVQIINRKKSLQSWTLQMIDEIFIIKNQVFVDVFINQSCLIKNEFEIQCLNDKNVI